MPKVWEAKSRSECTGVHWSAPCAENSHSLHESSSKKIEADLRLEDVEDVIEGGDHLVNYGWVCNALGRGCEVIDQLFPEGIRNVLAIASRQRALATCQSHIR